VCIPEAELKTAFEPDLTDAMEATKFCGRLLAIDDEFEADFDLISLKGLRRLQAKNRATGNDSVRAAPCRNKIICKTSDVLLTPKQALTNDTQPQCGPPIVDLTTIGRLLEEINAANKGFLSSSSLFREYSSRLETYISSAVTRKIVTGFRTSADRASCRSKVLVASLEAQNFSQHVDDFRIKSTLDYTVELSE
jgi:hypothetical protein